MQAVFEQKRAVSYKQKPRMADSERSNSENPELKRVLYDRWCCAAGWQAAMCSWVTGSDVQLGDRQRCAVGDRQRCATGWQAAMCNWVTGSDVQWVTGSDVVCFGQSGPHDAQLAENFWVTMGKITALQNVVCRCCKFCV
jgi:hypothetical protein